MATQIGSMGGKTKPNEIYRCVFDPIIDPLILSPEEWERIKIAWNIKPIANA
jgi:hypothetical protein